jgi:hypothetical protein
MKGLICAGRSVCSFVLKMFEKTDILESANLPKSTNLVLLIVSLLGLSFYQLTTSTVYLDSYGNLVTNTISSLVYAPNGWLQTVAFFVLGVSILALAILLQLRTPVRLNLGAMLVALVGFAVFLIGTCPAQYLQSPVETLLGTIHKWSTVAVVILLPIAGYLVAATFKAWNYRFLYIYTIVNSTFQLLFVFAGGYFLTMHYDLSGLFERVLFGNGQMWLTVICLNFLSGEGKYEFPVISRNRVIAQPVLYCLLYVYGSMLLPVSLSFMKYTLW